MDSTVIIGVVSGLSGSIIGGYLSYRGSRSGADLSFNLQKKIKEDSCRKQIVKLLEYTHSSIKQFCEKDTGISANARLDGFLYDKEWYKYIAFIPELTEQEYSETVTWCSTMLTLEEDAKRHDGCVKMVQIQNMFNENASIRNKELLINISNIIKKLKQ